MKDNEIKNTIIMTAVLALSIPFISGWSFLGTAKISETCAINSHGLGKCTFTNTGDGSGTVCGKVVMNKTYEKTDTRESDVICSGSVEPLSSKSIDVHIPNSNDFCVYSSSCEYSWVEK